MDQLFLCPAPVFSFIDVPALPGGQNLATSCRGNVIATCLCCADHSLAVQGFPGYRQPVAVAATVIRNASLQYRGKAVRFPVAIKNRMFSYRSDTVTKPSGISYQIPSYYFLSTGKIMTLIQCRMREPSIFHTLRKWISMLLIRCSVFSTEI